MNVRFQKPRQPGTTKEVVSQLIEQAGGPKRAAVSIGVEIAQAYAFTDPAQNKEIKYDQVRRLVLATGATAAAEDLAALAGGVFIPLRSDSDAPEVAICRTPREYAQLMELALTAMRDGRVDHLEASGLIKAARDLHHVTGCLVAALLKQQESRNV